MKRLLFVVAAAIATNSTAAHADENYFGYSYGAETLPKGASEAYVWITDRRGKAEGHYDAQDYKFELEHGITDRLQVSAYANFRSHHIDGLEPEFDDVHRDFGFQGLQASLKYNVLSPYKDGVGLAFYVEPGWSRISGHTGETGTQYSLELKAIVQKNFLDDRLIWATNLTLEPEWEKEHETDPTTGRLETKWEKELEVEVTTGLSYRVAPNWFIGAEGRYLSIYPNWTDGLHRENYALSAGPTIHYSGKRWWFTATYLPQIHGSPSEPGRSLHLDEYEKRELRLKVGYNF